MFVFEPSLNTTNKGVSIQSDVQSGTTRFYSYYDSLFRDEIRTVAATAQGYRSLSQMLS